MDTFEDFLRDCLNDCNTKVVLTPRICKHGKVHFFAFAEGGPISSDTFKAVVEGKHVRRVGETDGKATMFDMLDKVAQDIRDTN